MSNGTAQYTAGPYVALVEEPYEGPNNIAGIVITDSSDDEGWVALAFDQGEETEDRERTVANAHLFAAAPDLLAALKAALAQVNCDGDLCMYQWHEDAKAAVAKAEGRDRHG